MRNVMLFSLMACLLVFSGARLSPVIPDALIDDEMPALLALYQYLHQHPELSLHEEETAKKLAGELRDLGFEVTEQVGGTGLVGRYRNGAGPTLLIRTDLDALPINEKTGLAYASQVRNTTDGGLETGLMHACGHDIHMTVWTGVARTLIALKAQWQGTLVMIGQPAEEIGAGAKAMLDDGLYDRFGVPDYGLALHCNPTLEAGKIGYATGPAMASVDMVSLKVFGKGGHGAYPHTTVDPVVLASMIVMDLQTVVSRSVKPTDAAVVTVGAIHGGTAGNVISDEVEMLLTLRSYKPEVRDLMLERIQIIANGNAMAMGLPESMYPQLGFTSQSNPSVLNSPELAERLRPVFMEAVGDSNVLSLEAVMGGEDFARYGRTPEAVPTLMFWLGTVDVARKQQALATKDQLPGLHSPFYYPDPEATIRTGVKAMSSAAMSLLLP
jgi:hippurate hydrolase